ncbi:helix-turn-helix transcriptional regulator [Ilyomonas limi]|uniref:Helix-turn-helix transcriptional regulator n=1 Tax=Ilyomonas limi TaxID=2575867 RepID=A0A4U3LD43_9BACT|nr:AraC family transcriptional regulator [Ilyomonas limi]TKK71996.1 helix-turn-helix transcriptional regulator [Ilyomonas limi]
MQKQSTIFIKGMVCNRCVLTVKNELERLGHVPAQVTLGEVTIWNKEEALNHLELERRLSLLGFSLLEDKKTKVVKELKVLVEEVYCGNFDFPNGFRFSNLVRERLNKDYEAISDAFIAMEKRTIEQYIIEFRINKVKEFLVYTPLTLSDIAFKLNFNSVAHLSTQFKQHTGLTPSFFKEVRKQKTEVVFSAN